MLRKHTRKKKTIECFGLLVNGGTESRELTVSLIHPLTGYPPYDHGKLSPPARGGSEDHFPTAASCTIPFNARK